MAEYKYEVHGRRDGKPFYSTFKAVDNPSPDPSDPALIIRAAGKEKKAHAFYEVYDKAKAIYESIGVENVEITDSRF